MSSGAAVIILGRGGALPPFLLVAYGPLSSSTFLSLCLVEPPSVFPAPRTLQRGVPPGEILAAIFGMDVAGGPSVVT